MSTETLVAPESVFDRGTEFSASDFQTLVETATKHRVMIELLGRFDELVVEFDESCLTTGSAL